MLFSVVFNNSRESPNKYVCQFFKCIFMHMNEIAQNTFFIDNIRYKGLTGKICCLLNMCFLFGCWS